MKRKNMITGFAILSLYLGAYLFAAFVLWELNPAEWEMHVRFSVVTFPTVIAPLVVAALAEI